MIDKIKQVNDLCAANGAYINQHGKKTVSAWSKIKYFREVFGTEFGINCRIVEHSDRYVIMKCIITKSDPEHVISTGYSKQYRDKAGYLETAETFAITRALSFMGLCLEDLTSKEEYEELDIPVQPMNTKDTTSANNRYDVDVVNELIKKVSFAPHTAKLDFLWRANKDLLNQIKIKDQSTYNSILQRFNSKRDEITTQNEV
ncbi:MAG: hypothetical protein ACO3UU_13105 [Minisyncoccia bacterium]